MSVTVSYKKQVAFTLILIVIALFVVEGIARIYDYLTPICSLERATPYQNYPLKYQICSDEYKLTSECDPITGFCNVLKPNQHLQTITINSLGFRGDEFQPQKPDNTIRIFVVGGSTVLDLRSPENKTLTSFLQNYYQSLHTSKRVEVINAGNSAFESTQELLLIKNKILQYSPDVIIVYDGINDVYHPIDWSAHYYVSKYQNESLIYQFKNLQAKYFPFYKTVDFFYSLSTDPANPFARNPFDDSHMPEKVQRWKQNLLDICDLGKQHNFKTVVALQPLLRTGNKKLTVSEKELFRYYEHDKIVPDYGLFAEQLDSMKSSCDDVFDLRNAFDNVTDDLYFDGQHVSFEGDNVIAQNLFNSTKQIVLDFSS